MVQLLFELTEDVVRLPPLIEAYAELSVQVALLVTLEDVPSLQYAVHVYAALELSLTDVGPLMVREVTVAATFLIVTLWVSDFPP